jgi:hypothetical protein
MIHDLEQFWFLMIFLGGKLKMAVKFISPCAIIVKMRDFQKHALLGISPPKKFLNNVTVVCK